MGRLDDLTQNLSEDFISHLIKETDHRYVNDSSKMAEPVESIAKSVITSISRSIHYW